MLFITQEEEIKLDKSLQALYFYTTWMPFHSKLVYVISQIEEKYKDVSYLAIDADHFHTQCIRFAVLSVPTLLLLKEGREVKRLEGSIKKQDFNDAFADICIL
jgi:thioredoxin-like negative regulator of GroEL